MGTAFPGLTCQGCFSSLGHVLWLGAAVAHLQQAENQGGGYAAGSGVLKAHVPGCHQNPDGAENNSYMCGFPPGWVGICD